MNAGVYTLNHKRITVSSAISIMQIKAGANTGFEIVRAMLNQTGSNNTGMFSASLIRKSIAATVTAAVLGGILNKNNPNDSDPTIELGTGATGISASNEGTDSEEVLSFPPFNVLNGMIYKPRSDERIYVPAGGIIALKLNTILAGTTWTGSITIKEG